MASASADALRILTGRDLSIAECRARLLDRGHSPADVEEAIGRLVDQGALDDGRVARAYARTAAAVKGRGRLRVARELHEKGIDRETAAAAVADVFGGLDERALVARAVQKKLRGRPRPASEGDYARLYQFLMRQGFPPATIAAEFRRLRSGGDADD